MDCCRAVKGVFDAALDRLGAEQKKHCLGPYARFRRKVQPLPYIRGLTPIDLRFRVVVWLGGSLGQT